MKSHLFVLVLLLIAGFVLISCGKKSESNKQVDAEGIITNSIGMKLKRIEPGEFMMGSKLTPEEVARKYNIELAFIQGYIENEHPRHKVKITKPFYIGVYEVTQEQYEKVMGKNPSRFKGADLPVEMVSWDNAKEFCKKLSEKEGLTYRLPTEAEWEYACRAGTETEFYWGDEMDGDYAWYNKNSDRKTYPVGKKKPNAWGLYDMSGNVYEWCEDWYDEGYYENSPVEDPAGPVKGDRRVLRGGSGAILPLACRSAFRNGLPPGFALSTGGFRVVREAE